MANATGERWAVRHRAKSAAGWAVVGFAESEKAAWKKALDLMAERFGSGGDWSVCRVACDANGPAGVVPTAPTARIAPDASCAKETGSP